MVFVAHIALPDGLPGSWQPQNPAFYREAGKRTSELGYVNRNCSMPVVE
jgi:hypothetical protein